MSREINFRIWSTENGRYERERLPNNVLKFGFDLFELDFFLDEDERENYIFEQYTGLKDKNGKKIYENCELDGRYRVEYIAPKFVGKDIIKGDIIELYDNKFTITKEHYEISQNSEGGSN